MQIELLKSKYGIGLTGGIATGKSTVAAYLRECGILVIDADILARKVVEKNSEGLAQIQKAFGSSVMNADSTLNRAALSKLIFDNKPLKSKLESITHPLIQVQLMRELTEAGLFQKPKVWFYEAALLFEVGKDKNFHQIWATYCDEPTQITRLCKRNNLSASQAKLMIAAQLPAHIKRDHAHFSIDTQQDLTEIKKLIQLELSKLNLG